MKFGRIVFVCSLLVMLISTVSAQRKYWIEFKDKNIEAKDFRQGTPLFDQTLREFSSASLKRRALQFHTNDVSRLLTIEDAPIRQEYISMLGVFGVYGHTQSRWLNGVSATLTQDQFNHIRLLPFIKSIYPVGVGVLLEKQEHFSMHLDQPLVTSTPTVYDCTYDSIISHYGLTQNQLVRLNVPPLHAMGFDGSGVTLGVLDVGFRWRAMRATKMHHVIAEYDFVYGDSLTANDSLDAPNGDGHGSAILSTLTAFLPDTLVGPAYHPDLLLAKTEDTRSETPREEGNYAAALEWMEKLGVDITTSSLGYRGFDSGFVDYQNKDLDGRTAISTRAVVRAQRLGVLVCTASGNGGQSDPPSLNAPSDADSILSVGALDVNDSIAGFSSNGPTVDGRIKPDISAPGVAIATMSPGNDIIYDNGTSLATPLVAGACALIKQAHPEASAQQIRKAVITTGIAYPDPVPNNVYGYGRIDAYAAALTLGTIIAKQHLWKTDSLYSVCVPIAANNHIKEAKIIYAKNVGGNFVESFPLSLVTDSLIYSGRFPALPKGTHVRYYIALTDGADTITRSPRNAPDSVFEFYIGDTMPSPPLNVSTRQPLASLSFSPNPTRGIGTLHTSTEEPIHCTLTDNLGRIVFEFSALSGNRQLRLDLTSLPNGVYQLRANGVNGANEHISIVIAK